MKKVIASILLLFCVAVTSAFCQTDGDSAHVSKFAYCELVGYQKAFSTKMTVTVDYGDERKVFQDSRMRDETTGKVQAFNSMMDALNYMSKQGWLFLQAYVVTVGSQNYTHWMLRKRME